MTVFERVKRAVSLRDAAECYGLAVTRNGMALCPFHEDHNPSLKLNEDYFYCFGCGAKGDVIDFTGKLLGISSWSAAQKLEQDFCVESPEELVELNDELLCIRVLHDYDALLLDWNERYTPERMGEPVDDRYVESCQMMPVIGDLLESMMKANAEERRIMVKRLMEDDLIDELREYVARERTNDRNLC